MKLGMKALNGILIASGAVAVSSLIAAGVLKLKVNKIDKNLETRKEMLEKLEKITDLTENKGYSYDSEEVKTLLDEVSELNKKLNKE